MKQIPTIAPMPDPQKGSPISGLLNTTMVERYWRALIRHKWIIAGIFLACLTLAFILTLLMTPVYTATARIAISRTEENVTNVQGLEAEDAGKSLEFYQTQYSLLETKSLAERVARALNLANDRAFTQAFNLAESDEQSGVTASNARFDRVVGVLRDNIEINPIRGSSLVDIAFTSPSPALSAKIANAWGSQFIQSNLDRRFESTKDARDFLEGRLQSLREKLQDSEAALVNYASVKRIIPLSTIQSSDGRTTTERTITGTNLEALNSALADATAERIRAESALRTGGVASAATLSNSAINGLREQRALLNGQYANLLATFAPQYPQAVALKSQIDALDKAIEREEARVQSTVSTDYRQAIGRENELRSKVNSLKNQMIAERRDSIEYAILQREVDTNRQLYDGLLQRYKEIGVAGVSSNNTAIVDRADAPGSPSSPNLIVNILLAIILATLLSAGFVVLFEYVDQSLKDPQDVDRLLGVPLLGSVPRASAGDLVQELLDRKSHTSEAYLSVKTNLSFLTDHGVPRTFMLTSTAPNEGKSISSFALAQILARSGKSVVLVDADMRNPSVHRLLGLENTDGLSNFLSGQDDWQRLLRQSGIEQLTILDSGPPPPNSAELLSGPRMSQLIASLASRFDHVVVDSPPILGLADAPLLSSSLEGVILAIEANRHKFRAIHNALRRLQSANANILGAIVTKLDERNSAYGYGHGYGYGYGYGDRVDRTASVA